MNRAFLARCVLSLFALLLANNCDDRALPYAHDIGARYCNALTRNAPDELGMLFVNERRLVAESSMRALVEMPVSPRPRWECSVTKVRRASCGFEVDVDLEVLFDDESTREVSTVYVNTDSLIEFDAFFVTHPGTAVAILVVEQLESDDPLTRRAGASSLRSIGVPLFGFDPDGPIEGRVVAIAQIEAWWDASDGMLRTTCELSETDRERARRAPREER